MFQYVQLSQLAVTMEICMVYIQYIASQWVVTSAVIKSAVHSGFTCHWNPFNNDTINKINKKKTSMQLKHCSSWILWSLLKPSDNNPHSENTFECNFLLDRTCHYFSVRLYFKDIIVKTKEDSISSSHCSVLMGSWSCILHCASNTPSLFSKF